MEQRAWPTRRAERSSSIESGSWRFPLHLSRISFTPRRRRRRGCAPVSAYGLPLGSRPSSTGQSRAASSSPMPSACSHHGILRRRSCSRVRRATRPLRSVARSKLRQRRSSRRVAVPCPRLRAPAAAFRGAHVRPSGAGALRQAARLPCSIPRWVSRGASARPRESDLCTPKDPPLPLTLVALSGKAPL